MQRVWIALITSLSIACFAATAQDAPSITRADLAAAYLRVERAIQGKQLDPEEAAALNKTFDQATLAFFQQKFGDALRQIDSVSVALAAKNGGNPDFLRKASALRVFVDPPVVRTGDTSTVTLHIEQLYLPGAPGEAVDGRIEVRDRLGEVKASEDFKLRLEKGRPVNLAIGLRGGKAGPNTARMWFAEPGKYSLWIASDSFTRAQSGVVSVLPGPSGQFTVVDSSLDAVREANVARLDALQASTPAMEQALASVKARNNLLSDRPDLDNTAQYVLDSVRLSNEIASEIDALEKGTNPFHKRQGDYWRVLKTADREIPLRVYCPQTLDLAKPVPLVVAFHGAGVDENAFMDAYGAGQLKGLAEEHQFLLITPLTYAFSGGTVGDSFDALLQSIGDDYPIDENRVYVLGHSMGGGVTAAVVAARGTRIAAASPICGFRGLAADAQDIPPTLVIAAEHDPLAAPSAVGAAAEKAKAAGFPVEYRLVPHYGHTLVVAEVMPGVIEWLLAKSRI